MHLLTQCVQIISCVFSITQKLDRVELEYFPQNCCCWTPLIRNKLHVYAHIHNAEQWGDVSDNLILILLVGSA